MGLDGGRLLVILLFVAVLSYVVLGSGMIVGRYIGDEDAIVSNVVDEFGFRRYVSPDGAYEFSFPSDWVVEREFETRNDLGVAVRGVVIRRDICDNGNNWVYVNPKVSACDIGECVVIGNNTIVTYTDDSMFYVVFEDVVKSFVVK